MLRRIDDNGFFVEDVLLNEIPIIEEAGTDENGNECEISVIDNHYVDAPCPEGFYIPKWTGSEWVEGATQEYIDSLKPTPTQTTDEKLEELVNTITEMQMAVMLLSLE